MDDLNDLKVSVDQDNEIISITVNDETEDFFIAINSGSEEEQLIKMIMWLIERISITPHAETHMEISEAIGTLAHRVTQLETLLMLGENQNFTQ